MPVKSTALNFPTTPYIFTVIIQIHPPATGPSIKVIYKFAVHPERPDGYLKIIYNFTLHE